MQRRGRRREGREGESEKEVEFMKCSGEVEEQGRKEESETEDELMKCSGEVEEEKRRDREKARIKMR